MHNSESKTTKKISFLISFSAFFYPLGNKSPAEAPRGPLRVMEFLGYLADKMALQAALVPTAVLDNQGDGVGFSTSDFGPEMQSCGTLD